MVVCKFFQQGHCRYGQSCRFEHVYGSKYSYRAPQTSAQEVFKSNSASDQGFGSSSSASSLFRNAVQNATPFANISNSTFYPQSQSRASVFDRLGPQANTFSNQSNQAKSIFAQANQSVFAHTKPVTNIFQNQNQTVAKSLFAQASQSIFGQHQAQTNFVDPQNKTAVSSNIGSVFHISERPTSNVFGTSHTFSGSTAFVQNNNNEDHIYSKLEDLSPTDIEAFESVEFKLGFIPELPPPRVLCA